MKINKKQGITIIIGALLLAACSVGPAGMSVNLGLGGMLGRHVGLGTSINIPIRLDPISSQNNNTTGSPVIGEQILAYFDTHGVQSDQAVKGGFLRKLISKRSNNEYLVQDFYSDNQIKRTDPMLLAKADLFTFQAHPQNGSLTVYAYNGAIMQQKTYQNGKLVHAQY